MQKYKHVRPAYFGWFLSPEDSRGVTTLCRDVLARASDAFPEFKEEFGPDPSSSFNRDACQDKECLHCTAKFFKAREEVSKAYMDKACQEVGTASTLTVSAFVVSGRTLGAKVGLHIF